MTRVADASGEIPRTVVEPDRLRDDDPTALRATATRCRAAFGVKDSIRDSLPESLTEPFLDSIDRLVRELNRARG